MANDNQLAVAGNSEQMAALRVRQQVNQLQYLMKDVLKKGDHYGVVPGTKGKPSLFQPGAEKICLMFKLVPRYRVEKVALPGGHREVEVTCTLYQRGSDVVEGEGIGSCSTMESKYRYRTQWSNGSKTKVENPDIADTYNTVLKMAKKRALVDAVKSTTAASDIFTQDVEDLPDWMRGQQPAQAAQDAKVEPQAPAGPSDEDKVWLRDATARLVSEGYVEGEVKAYLWQQFKDGGRAAAQQALEGMLGAAQDPQPEPVEYEAEDVEF
jgi:hypothetical protein